MTLRHYLKQNLLAIDQFGNTLLGGYADETLSSRAYRASLHTGHWRWRVCATVINALFFNRKHCEEAYLSERNHTQLPPEFRTKSKDQNV